MTEQAKPAKKAPVEKNETPAQETFLDRLKKEKDDLGEKLDKLSSFIQSDNFGKIESNQRRLLKQQIGHMREYHAVLIERIKLLA
jgi:hypothetical protein